MPFRTRPTIKDVAREAGVSISAASSVLNGNRHAAIRVSEATQARIRETAVRLAYRPSELARSFQRRRTQVIALARYGFTTISRDPFTWEILDGTLNRALALGYDLRIHVVRREDHEKPGVLGDGRVDGCIWVAPHADDAAISSMELATGELVVLCAGVEGGVPCAVCDNRGGIEDAVEHLARLGHRRLLYIENRDTGMIHDGRARRTAFEDACIAHGLPGRILPYAELAAVLSSPSPPTAVIGWSDSMAFAVMRCAQELGLSIPQDLSIVGFNSNWLCDNSQPPLTSVRQPIRAMAEYATDLLIARIEGRELPAAPGTHTVGDIHVFPCSLDVRGSTGPAPMGEDA